MRVIVVEDSVLVREGLRALLVAAGHEVLAALERPGAVPALVRTAAPDVLVVDIRLPPSHTDEGLRLAEQVRAIDPRVALVVLSQHVVVEYALRLLGEPAGGRAYLLKDRLVQPQQLLEAVQRAVEGGTVVDPALVEELVRARSRSGALAVLSRREREVLALMAQGLSDRGIAERLRVSLNTVGTHVQHVFAKLAIPAGADQNRRVHAVLAHLGRT
ncbi:LuxR C-terminal-related transcriptional regulator [Kineococcus gypseus]|uniref:LuxR C-terminal-related transcriptional regulator n=1 Tax=Kineococcus gypseus TaxID=1637102 RepID=UPI003D7E28C6